MTQHPQCQADTVHLTRDDLLILLIEECGEVIQAATKCLRFGYDIDSGVGYGNNRTVLSREIGDVFAQRASATDEQILAGARAMCSLNAIRQFQRVDYDGLDVREREHWEDMARVCLTVALPSAMPRTGKEWTPEQYWEYVEGLAGEFEAGQMRDMLSERGLAIVPLAQSSLHPVDIGNAIIAGIAEGETSLEQMSAIVERIKLAGFVIVPASSMPSTHRGRD